VQKKGRRKKMISLTLSFLCNLCVCVMCWVIDEGKEKIRRMTEESKKKQKDKEERTF
jgi:formate/nitrite transporter FocA (FNT family)